MRIVFSAFILLITFSVFVSCNKEKSFEVGAPARGSLKSSANGDCLPKTAAGAFVAGTALADSNYLEIDVEVASIGTYTIRTDTVNGYSFNGIGTFSEPGLNRIRLAASGTPTVAGQDEFTVIFDTSFCFVPVTVLPAGSNTGPAAFTLQGSGDTCMIASVAGNYVQNVALDGANTVSIKVNATTAGTYSVTTNTVNDFQFSGSGSIATTGEQIITLTGSGTPTTEGATVFTVSAGGTTCTFTVTVTASGTPPPVSTDDLLPLSLNSWWSYVNQEGEAQDTLAVTNAGTVTFNQKTYNKFEFKQAGTLIDETYFRKEGADYYEYGDVTKYSGVEFDTEQQGDILFLKENLTAGATWQSADFTGAFGGVDITLRYLFTCTDVNVTETINGKPISGITKISFKASAGSGGVFTDAGPVITMYYAKGIGLVYQAAENTPDFTLFIKNWHVN